MNQVPLESHVVFLTRHQSFSIQFPIMYQRICPWLILPILLLVHSNKSSAQNTSGDFDYSFSIEAVSYSGEQFSEYIPMQDDNRNLIGIPHFTQEDQKPVAYVSGTFPKVSAVISTDCAETFFVRGTGERIAGIGSDRIRFESKELRASNGRAIYPTNCIQRGVRKEHDQVLR